MVIQYYIRVTSKQSIRIASFLGAWRRLTNLYDVQIVGIEQTAFGQLVYERVGHVEIKS